MWNRHSPIFDHFSLCRLVLLLSLSLAVYVGTFLLDGAPQGAEAQPASDKPSPTAKAATGPRDTDFSSQGFKISKVVRMERSLNALGIAAQFGKTNKVGKYVELPKRLEPAERGEHFVITWKYAGKSPPLKASLKFEYKLSNEVHLETIIKDYPNLRKGTYRLRIENTGDSYRRRGQIEYWRAGIFADGESVARKDSFLWPVFRGAEASRTGGGG